MEKPYGRHSPDRRVLGLVNNNNIYNPTDNLDLLTNVASELADSADRARKLGLQTKGSSRRSSDFKPRKDKSLGILCDKFLAMFPLTLDDDCPSLDISLDRVANQLEIVKRRIYDIINILESLHMTARVAKNRYEWHGNRHLKPVLTHLKRLALQYGLDAKMREVQVQQKSLQSKNATTTVPFTCGCSDSSQTTTSSLPFDSENFFHDERTLGIMCQKFIMLFLVTDPGHSINLDVATQMLVNSVERPPASQQPSSDGAPPVCSCQPRHKTKVRRLYDIANVLTSLGLIRKERYNNTPVRKPVFVYNGPSIDDYMMEPLDLNGAHTMRNSLLMVPVNEAKEFNAHNRTMRLNRKRKDECTYGPAEKHFCSSSDDSNDTKPARLGSLEDILRVAEQELKLLMSGVSEETSMSLPITCDGFDLSNVKQEPLVKEEPLSDDDTNSGPSSSFDSCGSAMTNYSYESEPMPDLSVVKTEYPAEETEPITVERAASPVPETVLPVEDIPPLLPEAVPVEEAVSETITTTAPPTVLPIESSVLPIAAGVPDENILSAGSTVLPAGSTVLPAGSTIFPAGSTVVPAGSTVVPAGSTVLPAASTEVPAGLTDVPIGSSVLPAGSAVLPAGSSVLPAGSAVLPAGTSVLPAGSAVLPAGSSVLPAGSTVLPAGSTVLPAGSTVLPAGSAFLPAGSTVLPAGSTVFPAGSTVFPAGTTVLPVGSTVLPVGSTVLPLAQLKLAEALSTEGKSAHTTDQMVNIKLVSSSGDVTYQKIPAFSCSSVASMQSGNDQLAIGKLKRFTVTRKLIPSHFVLQKDPSNNMKLTLHHAPNAPNSSNASNGPNVKGLIRLRPVASSPKLCLPVTCIKTLKTINVVKAAGPTAGVPRTVEIKKRLHLVPLNSGNPKGNISAVQ